ncbi:hypothetical protein E3N88_37751 [Mikania micrantha]|uniref:Leucine-rich repeat-containing N-terminal plant-type domain-containing protein n=1 Tax=Mikania micrantha TaxID=192012 RepID=A0A5N6LS12_9ASTR|nr:hypothetical protein E3N88_37751 [Mikania micrantha]
MQFKAGDQGFLCWLQFLKLLTVMKTCKQGNVAQNLVGCDSRKGHVVKLDLRRPGPWEDFNKKWLEGELSPSLQNLKHLRYLDLSMNFFSAPTVDDLRWVSSLSSLRYLDLSGIVITEQIDWFHPVNMLPSLLTLNLGSSLYMILKTPSVKSVNFTSLTSLDLSQNNINSTFPVWLSNLTGLMHLDLNRNSFHGKIPDFIGTFSALASIDLSYNSFKTLIPDPLCNLSSLVHLGLSHNMFSGLVPSNLGLLLRLEYLNLYYNQLSGNIPMVSNLVHLDLSRNLFSVPIPSSIGLLSSTIGACLLGVFISWSEDICVHTILILVATTSLQSSRWIPPFQLQIFRASSCNIGPYFPNWLHTQTHLQKLDLSNSSIRGTIPEWFENIISHILYLDLSNNEIGGKMPPFHFDSNVEEFYLRTSLKMNSNKFEGSLAAFPSNVELLDLSDNLLSGDLPQTDGTMNLSFDVVNLSKNRFSGNIPIDLCKLPSIIVLDLSQNKLSGRLPECLGNLSGLQAMDLSNNTITGHVPSSLGSLTQLMTLHLHNIFEGNLPLSLQNLTSLVTMDIGYNFLVGNIPFWKPSVLQGNNGLCGLPLSRSCKGDSSSYDHISKVEAQDDDEGFWLYAGMGAGFVVGFLGSLGSLHLIRSWRVAYFETFENFYTSILVNLACLRRTFVS